MSYPGRPPEGTVLWGASVGWDWPDIIEPRHEEPAGVTMQLHRMFYQWSHVTGGKAYNEVKRTIAEGRFPWVSFKFPGSWVDVAAGKYDGEIANLLLSLDLLGVPIWLTFHHEPDGGGGSNKSDESSGPEGHKAANRKVRQLMTMLGTENLALSLVLMGWTWDPASRPGDGENRDPDNWWDGEIYDFIGIDPYIGKEATMLNANWYRIMDWAWHQGVDVGVAEWGVKAARYMYELYDYCLTATEPRVTSLAYFDVEGNWSHGPWLLEGPQLHTFHDIMRQNALVVPEPEARFEDVPPDHQFFTEIEWMAAEGITRGCNPPANDLFCPEDVVTREQMAAFMYRAAHPDE